MNSNDLIDGIRGLIPYSNGAYRWTDKLCQAKVMEFANEYHIDMLADAASCNGCKYQDSVGCAQGVCADCWRSRTFSDNYTAVGEYHA